MRCRPAGLPLFAALPPPADRQPAVLPASGPAGGPATGQDGWRPAGWPFGPLRPQGYRRLIADPPWRFALRSPKGEGKSPQAHYACMDLPAIQALPVARLAHPAGCILMLWCTWPMLPQGLETLAAWGFRHLTGGAWLKRTAGGKVAVGTGYRLRSTSEPFLLAATGAPPLSAVAPYGHLEAAVREHSRKPDEQYALMEAVAAGPGAELFARQSWPGWDAWGNEVGKFTQEGNGGAAARAAAPLPAPLPSVDGNGVEDSRSKGEDKP